jgi:hypothetical protein
MRIKSGLRKGLPSMKNPVLLVLALAIAPLGWASGSPARAMEATVLMERLAAKIEHAQKLHPDTAREIARLMAQPPCDCTQVRCSETLRARNVAARHHLERLLASKTP